MKYNLPGLKYLLLSSILASSIGFASALPEGAFKGQSQLLKGNDVMAFLIKKDPANKDRYYAILSEYDRVPVTHLGGKKMALTKWVPRMYVYRVDKIADLEYTLSPLLVTAAGEIDINTSVKSSTLMLKASNEMNGAELIRNDQKSQVPEKIKFKGVVNSTWEPYVPGKYFGTIDNTGGDYLKKGVNTELFTDFVAKFSRNDIFGEFSIAEKAPGLFVFTPQGNNLKGTDKIQGRIGVFVDIVNWKSFGLEKFTTEELLLINTEDANDVGFYYERHQGYLVHPRSWRGPSSSNEETPWTTWSEKGTIGGILMLKGIREELFEKNLHDPHVGYLGYKSINCDNVDKSFRSADGTCTDLSNANVGAAGVAFGRNVSQKFIDQNAAAKLMIPNPSLVSKEFFTRDEFKPVPFLNMLAAVWIQFMNHDWMSHGKNMVNNPYVIDGADGKTHYVERTQGISNTQNDYKRGYGKISANTVTHWWDGSQIYGSSQEEQNTLRAFSGGKMRMEVVNGRELLPKGELTTSYNKQNQGYEMTGFRDNWWVGLSMLHSLFVKEHNAIAEKLMKKHVTFDQKTSSYIWKNEKVVKRMDRKQLDEKIFQTARLINAAVMAKIHTVEWTPAILPNKTLKIGMYTNWYGLVNPQTWSKYLKKIPGFNQTDWFTALQSGYLLGGVVGDQMKNHGVPFSITEEFTSVYRLHSLLPEKLDLRTLSDKHNVNSVTFDQTRNEKSYDMMANNDPKDLFYSFGRQNPGQIVLNNFPKFMQELNIPGQRPMDLGMVDIVRDRERGVPRYNQFRRAINLRPIKTYRDFFPANEPMTAQRQAVLDKFYKVYGKDSAGNDNVEMVDLLVGTLAEEVRPTNFGFGETQFQIFILMASRRLMADRFFTTDYRPEYYTSTGLDWIDNEGTMAQVIVRHMPQLASKVEGLETAFNPWNE